jgi:hypothetical protein
LPSPLRTTRASPAGTSSADDACAGVSRSPTKCIPTIRLAFASCGALRTRARFGSRCSPYGFSRPEIRSLRTIAATVPFVIPHFWKPPATHSPSARGW